MTKPFIQIIHRAFVVMNIFDRVFGRLSKPTSEPKTEQLDSHSSLFSQVNRYASLIGLQDQRQLIEVISPDFTDSFQSMIIGVDLYQQQLIIDELSPKIQNPETLVGRKLTIRHQKDKQMINITVDVIAWSEDTQCLHLALPEDTTYAPRRRDYRMELLSNAPVNAVITPVYGSPWHSTLTNISLGGMRIIVSGDLRSELEKHKPLKKCSIVLPSNHLPAEPPIHCSGRVKSFRFIGRPYRRTEISIEFGAMSESDQLAIEQFIEQVSIAA